MAIYESKGFGSMLYLYKGNLEPFEYISQFKPMVVPEGADIEEFKRKQAPYCISGQVKADKSGTYKRSNESLINRDLIFLDYDNIDMDSQAFQKKVNEALSEYSYIIYPTIKHTKERPRFRLVVKPSDVMDEKSYKTTVESLSQRIGLPYDHSSLTWSQLQGLPVKKSGQIGYEKFINIGKDFPVIQGQEVKRETFPMNTTKRVTGKSITMKVVYVLLNGFGDEGDRNVTLTRFVGMLLNRYVGCDVPTAYELTRRANQNTSPPLPIDELDRTFESIVKSEIRKRGKAL